jgi:hypothetical protein
MRQTHAAGEKAFRRLCGRRRTGRRRPADWRNPKGANLRRRARRVELYLCESDLHGPMTLGGSVPHASPRTKHAAPETCSLATHRVGLRWKAPRNRLPPDAAFFVCDST